MALFGLGKGGFSADKTAKKQYNWNMKTAGAQAQLNAVNQVTPYGTSVFKPKKNKQGIIKGFKQVIKPTATQAGLIAQEEGLAGDTLGLQRSMTGNIAGMQPFSLSGLPALNAPDFSGAPAMPTADDEARQRVEDALYQRATARLDPEWTRRQTDLETQLANAGHVRGSPGWTQAMDDFNRQRTDAYDAARFGAIGMGGEEQARLFGLGLAGRQQGVGEEMQKFGAGSQLRNQMMAELLAERNQPFNELAMVRGFPGGSTMPQYNAPPQTAFGGTNYTDPAKFQYEQEQADRQGFFGSLFGLAGKALPFMLGGGA